MLLVALALPAAAQMRGGFSGRGLSSGHVGGFRGGFGRRGFVSRPLRHQGLVSPGVVLYPYSPFWWDEPEAYVEPPAPQPPPQPTVIVVDRDREPAPTAAAQPLIIEREGDRYVERRQATMSKPVPPPKPEAPPPPAVVILRNGRQLQVTDYAVATGSFYDLSGGRTHRIALADINVLATNKANEERGINLSLPFSTCERGDPGCATVNVY